LLRRCAAGTKKFSFCKLFDEFAYCGTGNWVSSSQLMLV
jgi:hypothetical protein